MNATTSDIRKWDQCKALAEKCGLKIAVRGEFILYIHPDDTGPLAVFATVDQVYAFLQGYEHYVNVWAEKEMDDHTSS